MTPITDAALAAAIQAGEKAQNNPGDYNWNMGDFRAAQENYAHAKDDPNHGYLAVCRELAATRAHLARLMEALPPKAAEAISVGSDMFRQAAHDYAAECRAWSARDTTGEENERANNEPTTHS